MSNYTHAPTASTREARTPPQPRMGRLILCGPTCGHDHGSLNGPTGCCEEHGPYMYFCGPCHDAWAAANPERVKEIRRFSERAAGRSIADVALPAPATDPDG